MQSYFANGFYSTNILNLNIIMTFAGAQLDTFAGSPITTFS